MTKTESNSLSASLKSTDNKIVLSTIKKIRNSGNNTILADLADLYDTNSNKEVKDNIVKLFADLKNQESVPMLIELIKTKKSVEIRKMLLSASWQSRLNLTDFLETYIDIVVSEPFELAFEAFTVIENIESKVNDERKKSLIKYAKSKAKKSREENTVLSQDLASIIEMYETL